MASMSSQFYMCHTGGQPPVQRHADISNISFILIHSISTYEQIP